MDFLVSKCAFCERRHLLEIDELNTWFARCVCGSIGFVQDEAELHENGFEGVGFTAREVTTSFGSCILLADPVPVFVDGLWRRIFVCWYRPLAQHGSAE